MKLNISKVLICIFVAVGTVDVVNTSSLYDRKDGHSLLRRASDNEGAPVECCPSVVEFVQKKGGRNRQGLYVELYRHNGENQTFYEYSCKSTVVDESCRTINLGFDSQSECVQKYTFQYALVKDTETSTPADKQGTSSNRVYKDLSVSTDSQFVRWNLDYIQLRSGCAFQLLGTSAAAPERIDEKHPDTVPTKNREANGD